MKRVWVVLLVILGAGVMNISAQSTAQATYAKNGALIGLADLAPLRECSVRSIDGKVKAIDEDDGMVSFDLASKKERMAFQFPLARLADPERYGYRKGLLRKGTRLRASGYLCKGSGGTLEAISVERVY
jgi:hypothetical protein